MKKSKALAGHEQVYHAAMFCQGKRSGLTEHSLHGEKKACPAKGTKKSKGSLLCPHEPSKQTWKISGHTPGMGETSGFKGLNLIAGVTHPHPIHNAHPKVCQSAQSHAVRFAFRQLALIVGSGPTRSSLPGCGKSVDQVALTHKRTGGTTETETNCTTWLWLEESL